MKTGVYREITDNQRAFPYIDPSRIKSLILTAMHLLYLGLVLSIDGLGYEAKVSLFAFLSAMTLWVATKIPAGFVAVGLIVFIVLLKGAEADLLYESFAEEVVWLMIGSFVIGEAVKQSGLAERFSRSILNRARSKSHVLYGILSVLFASAFFIPSTSGRAAISMPIMNQLGEGFAKAEKRTLALLVPVIILMSTSATLIGAGAHVIGIGLLERTSHQSISFLQWMIWGTPFALVITVLTLVVVKKMMWPRHEPQALDHSVSAEISSASESGTTHSRQPFNPKEKKTLVLITALMAGWMTESLHDYDTALVAMIGAILMMLPNYGVLSWKKGVQSVSWNLIVFVAAATALGKVLVDTGVVKWMESGMFQALHAVAHPPEWLMVLIILLITVTSHLYITSHTTRAVVFIPSLLVFSQTVGANPTAVVFLSLIGMNYCLTFPVSSKALLLFYEDGSMSYDARQLIKVSAVLMPIYIALMMLFYFTFWSWTGLSLNMR